MKNFSKQREEIKKAVQESSVHPTAEDVYEILRGRSSKVSLSTIYRNLHLLADEGILRKLYMPNGSLRFDGTLTPHQHAVCTACGKVFDIDYDAEALQEVAERQTGFSISCIQISMMGTCNACQKSKQKIS